MAPNDSDDILDDIYGPAPTFTDIEPREFKPWHKPRKHFIRIKQWCSLVQKLIKKSGLREGDLLKYFGMPGEDFLDIRTLDGVCKRSNIKMRYLGFDSTADLGGEYEFNLSKHEVYNLKSIDPMSVVVKDRIERIALEESSARMLLRKHGPFDVVNFDLCDSIAAPSYENSGSYFDALVEVCNRQVQGRTTPWLLFITTRASRDQIDSLTKTQLFQCIIENIQQHKSFSDQLQKLLELDEQQIQAEISNSGHLAHSALVKAFGLGIGKWLLSLMMSASPKLIVEMHNSYSYRVDGDEPDMLSLAFMFDPVIETRIDRTGITKTKPSNASATLKEVDLALKLIDGMLQIEDVDHKLANDSKLNESMIVKSENLLRDARYNVEGYRRWVLEHSPLP